MLGHFFDILKYIAKQNYLEIKNIVKIINEIVYPGAIYLNLNFGISDVLVNTKTIFSLII